MVAIDVIARDRASATFRSIGNSANTMASRVQGVAAKLGLVTGVVAAAGAGFRATMKLGLDFTEQLNTLQAVSGATAKQMAAVSVKAKALGNDISIPATSASDAAQAMTELAKGGLTVQQAMQAAKGTLQLAAAAQVSGAQAAQIQANALNTFGLKATAAGHVADVLANTANAASGEITDFAQAFQSAGSVAKLFGINIDDTSTALGLLANNGILGSDAGTSLKNMLLRLTNPSKAAAAGIQSLGLKVYDSQGKFEGLRALTGQLATAQKNMSQAAFNSAAGVVFGTKAIKAASILAQSGVSKFDSFEKSVEKVGGAADLAGAKMKGLPGALQNLENTAQSVALSIYQKISPAVEKLVNGFSGVISKTQSMLGWLDKIPGPIKDIGIALAGLAIAKWIGLTGKLSDAFKGVRSALQGFRDQMALQQALARQAPKEYDDFGNRLNIVGTAATDAETKMSNFSAAMAVARTRAGAVGKSLVNMFGGPWGLAITGATAAVTLFVDAWKRAHTPIVDANTLIDENTGKLLANSKATIASKLAQSGALTTAKQIGIAQGDVTNAILHGGKAYDDLIAKIKDYKKQQDGLAAASNGPIGSIADLFSDNTAGDHARQAAQLLQDVTNERNSLTIAEKSGAQAGAEVDAAQKKSNATLTVTAKLHKSLKSAQDNYVANLVAQHKALIANVSMSGAESDYLQMLKSQHSSIVDMTGAQANYLNQLRQQHTAAILETQTDKAVAAQAVKTAENIKKLVSSLKDARDKAHDLTGQATQLEAELARLSGRNVTVEEATRAFNGAMTQMAQAAKDSDGHTKMLSASLIASNGVIRTVTQSGQDLYDNVTSLGKAAVDQALAVAESTGKMKGQKAAQDAAAASLSKSRQAFIDSANQMGLTAAEAKKLADRYFGIPKNIKTIIKGDFTDVTDKLQRLADSKVVIPVVGVYSGTSGSPAHGYITAAKAAGGPVGNGRYLVGEKGPELLTLAPGSRGFVTPNSGLAAALAATARASGGSVAGYKVPSVASLAGVQTPDLGPVASTVSAALSVFRQAVSATASAVKTAASKASTAAKTLRAQVADQSKTAKQQAALVAKTRTEQAQKIANVRSQNASRIAEAQQRLKDAKTASSRATAQRELTKAQADADLALTKARQAGAAAVNKAVAAQSKANAAEAKKTAADRKAQQVASVALATAQRQADATVAVVARSKTLQQVQTNLAKTLDTVNTNLASAKDALSTLKGAKTELAGSISGQITSDTGIMGMDANGVTGILAGLKSNLASAKGFQSSLSTLAKVGLNANDLQQIASGGLAAAPLAKVLAAANPAQIKQLNSLESQIAASATAAGNAVASKIYNPAIDSQKAVEKSLADMKTAVTAALEKGAKELVKAQVAGLNGVTIHVQIGDEALNTKVQKIVKKDISQTAFSLAAAR